VLEDEDIIKDLKSQGAATRNIAIRRLVNKYQDHLYSQAMRWLKDPDWALTVVNDTFLTVIDKIHLFNLQRYGNGFRAWILQILINKCHDTHRKNERKEDKAQFVPFDESRFEHPEDRLTDGDIAVRRKIVEDYLSSENENRENPDPMIQEITQFIASLPERDRIIIVGCALGLAHSEVAEYAGIKGNQVKVYYHRLKRKLEKRLRSS